MSRWATAIMALLLVPAMATSTLATCLAAPAAATHAPMTCCAEQPDHCPMHRADSQTAADCCRHDGHRQRELTTAEVRPVQSTLMTLQPVATIAPFVLVPPASYDAFRASRSSGSPPTARSLRVTVLLI